jgi:ketosteroid isomerase-like protein
MDAVDRIAAERACERLIMRYALAVNDVDIAAFVRLFHQEAVWQRPGVPALCGHDAIRAFMMHQPKDRILRHVNGLCLVTLESEQAAGAVSQTTVYETLGADAFPAPLAGPHMIVEYRDRLVRSGDDWLFARRDTSVIFRR